MRFVRQNDLKSAKWASLASPRRGSGSVRGGIVVLAVVVVVSGCAGGGSGGVSGNGSPEPRGTAKRGTADPVHGQEPRRVQGERWAQGARRVQGERQAHTARVAAAKRWGLAKVPLAPPALPKRKPALVTRKGFEVDGHTKEALPPVFTTVPTRQKVVFLTIDDGAEKDPAFLRMMSELKIPYTAFLSDYLIKEDYGYFRRMRDRGVVLNNHTLNHRYMPALSYAAQKREICGMQDVIQKRYGSRPTLFRPPYGNYDRDTLRAAKACGIKAVPLWNEEVFVDRWEYRESDRDLRPGDIVLSHFRGRDDWKGTMPDMIRRFLNLVTDKGYAVARLEDYL